jgi:hypothetical protein
LGEIRDCVYDTINNDTFCGPMTFKGAASFCFETARALNQRIESMQISSQQTEF